MSLSVAALRMATVFALAAETSAADRVFDSDVDPRDLVAENAEPTIVVYAERGKRDVTGRDIIGADHHVELAIELFVAKASIVRGGDGSDEYEIEYPATDGAHENRLRRLAYEIETILTGSLSPWAEIWRSFAICATTETQSEWDRGADSEKGRRFNYLRLIYRMDVLGDPVRGAALSPPWQAILGLMAATPGLDQIARDWRALITTPHLPTWRNNLSSLGLRYAELRAIGLSPGLDHQATDVLPAAEMGDITLDPLGVSINVDQLSAFESPQD